MLISMENSGSRSSSSPLVKIDANNICGRPKFDFHCNATMSQHYIDIKKERKRKLIKIQNENY